MFAKDAGGVSIGNLVSLILLVLFIWGLISFFPVFNVPFELEGQVKDRVLDFLRRTPYQKAQADYREQARQEIVKTVSEILEGHQFDPKEVEKGVVIEGARYMSVNFKYTLIINYLGMEHTFDKEFEFVETLSF